MSSMARDQQPRPVKYTVHFLDNSEATFEVDKKDKAQVLLDKVFLHLELNEKDLFGLQFADVAQSDEEPVSASEHMRWIDPVKSLKKQMKLSSPYELYFRVKFYVPDPRCLKEEYTRYHFFLQLTKDLADGHLIAPFKTSVLMASYAVQSELGDYNLEEHGPGYLSEFHFIPGQTEEMLREVEELHKQNRGMSPATCEMLFIDIAKSLDGYGIDLFKATLDVINEDIQLGVTSLGLVVFQNNMKRNSFCWAKIIKISFKRKQFFVHLRKELDDNVENLFGFNMASYRSCKNLWKSCVEHHTFFCLHMLHHQQPAVQESPPTSQFSNSSSMKSCDKSKCFHEEAANWSDSERMFISKKVLPDALISSWDCKLRMPGAVANCSYCDHCLVKSNHPITSQPQQHQQQQQQHSALKSNGLSPLDCLNADVAIRAATARPDVANGEWVSSRAACLSPGGVLCNSTIHPNPLFQSDSRIYRSLDRKATDQKAPKKMTDSCDSKIDCFKQATSDDEEKRRCRLPNDRCFPMKIPSSVGSVEFDKKSDIKAIQESGHIDSTGLVVIRMRPDEQCRFGFNVKGGSDQKSPIIVSRVARGAPADCCIPRLMEGDQVLFINGRDVSHHTHAQVVQFIKASREIHSGELVLVVRPNVYISDDCQPDLQYIPDTHRIIAVLPPGGDPLAGSMTLLRESVESNAAVAQFEQIYRKKAEFTMNVSQLPENVLKNRYRDIAPYDQTRVRLKGSAEDYINANFVNMEISGSGIINRYIAAQGPLPETSGDFWLMIWEQQSSLITMLTTTVEQGRVKCHHYWPDPDQTVQFGKLSVTCLAEKLTQSFAFRDFALTHLEAPSEKHLVHQMQYIAWPDHGVPDDCTDFLEFVANVRQRRSGCVEPSVIHCSAGIGRTGVLIAMETAMCMIESNQPVHLLDIVCQMREQRAMLIQTSDQYKFVCEAVLKVYDDRIVEPLDYFNR